MNSELKTLIVLETNKLRSTIGGDVSYASFTFSSEFDELKSFIEDKELTDYVHIAIPKMAVDELLRQKIEQYWKDRQNLSQIIQRLSQLPKTDFTSVSLPDDDFNCEEHLKPLTKEFIEHENIKIIDFPEDKLGEIFKNIIKRVLEREPPFKKSNKSKDIGFKDTVIWESLLNYENLRDYDKVIFISQDSIFNEKCIGEFKSKVKKHFLIASSIEYVIAEITTDYQSTIEIKEWSDFANSDYFKDHISQFLKELDKVPVGNNEYELEEAKVINYIDSVEHLTEEEMEETDISIIIVSLVKSIVKIDNSEKEVFLKIRTSLDDTKGIVETDYEAIKDEGN